MRETCSIEFWIPPRLHQISFRLDRAGPQWFLFVSEKDQEEGMFRRESGCDPPLYIQRQQNNVLSPGNNQALLR